MTAQDRRAQQVATHLAISEGLKRRQEAASALEIYGYDPDPDAPYIQIYPENTSDEPIFTVRTKEDFDAMVDAVRRLADLREWAQRRWNETNEARRDALSAGDEIFALTRKYERDAFKQVLDRLNEESGQQ